jgi:hypothetical protein
MRKMIRVTIIALTGLAFLTAACVSPPTENGNRNNPVLGGSQSKRVARARRDACGKRARREREHKGRVDASGRRGHADNRGGGRRKPARAARDDAYNYHRP